MASPSFKRVLLAAPILLVLAAPCEPGGSSRSVRRVRAMQGTLVELQAGNSNNLQRVPPPALMTIEEGLGASVHVTYVENQFNYYGYYCDTWDAQAKAAFEYAATLWSSLVSSSVVIEVEACWTQGLAFNTLGSAGARTLVRDFAGAPASATWYPVALANMFAESDLIPASPDIDAQFNAGFSNWYFGTNNNTPSGKYDFVTVVLHEIGHGLGFFGTMSVDGSCGAGQGCWGLGTGYPTAFDRYASNGSGQRLVNTALFPNPSPALKSQLTGGNLFFDAAAAAGANGGAAPRLYAPATWQQGSSFSHLDEATYNGTANALMTPILGTAESLHNPGPVGLGVLLDLGWTQPSLGSNKCYLPFAFFKK